MDEVLRFFRVYEIWIYIILGIGGLYYFQIFLTAWRDLQGAVFGLERENAQTKLNRSATSLILLIILTISEFIIVSFVVPMYPQANPLLTPTVDLLSTSSVLAAEGEGTVVPTGSGGLATLTPEAPGVNSCVPGQIDITKPNAGEYLSGEVTIEGSATASNFGFYKLEYSLPSSSQWQPIQAGRVPVVAGVLVQKWDTTSLDNLEYLLRLVVTDNVGEALPDCQINVRINNP